MYATTVQVPQNLRAKEYLVIVNQNRARAFKLLNNYIKYKDWKRVAACTTEKPLSDVRTAALYLSWALVCDACMHGDDACL